MVETDCKPWTECLNDSVCPHTFVPRIICRSPGTKREQRAYSQAMVRITCRVDLSQWAGQLEDNDQWSKSFFTECSKMNLIIRPFQDVLHLNWCYLFQTLTVSPEAERTARLSELKASVRTSVRCPPSVRRAVLSATGVLCEVFRL